MVIVEDLQEFTRFIDIFRASENPIIIPVFSDARFHPLANRLSLLYVDVGEEAFILPYCHNEAINLPGDTLSRVYTRNAVCTPFIKTVWHAGLSFPDVIDLAGWHYLETGEVLDPTRFYPRSMKQMLSKFRQHSHVLSAMPMMVLVEYLETYTAFLRDIMRTPLEPGAGTLMDITIRAIAFMEQSGVKIDAPKLIEHYGSGVLSQVHDGYVYSDYNPYTITRRVTNKFGRLNFSGINKSDGSREAFISRHADGAIVHIDYEAFHVRMIGQMIQFPLPSESLHEYFGKQYFGKTELTPDEYRASKIKTMNLLYGSEKDKEASEIPYFIKVNEFINTLWTKAQEVGYIESVFGTQQRIYLSRIENAYPAKLFNYLLQLTESEITMQVITRLMEVMRGKRSKVTLYTYDALMIDFAYADGKELITEIVDTMEQEGTYPVRVYVGPNYHDLKNVTDVVKNRVCAH